MNDSGLIEHFFRHEYGRLVSILSCRIGVQYLEDIEDAVQSALMASLENWGRHGTPENPQGWLYRVANNHLMGLFRQRSHDHILDSLQQEGIENEVHVFLPGEVQDDLLRMLFVCCDEALPNPSKMVLALKILCGFDVREIAIRLFTSEANVYKRLTRARNILRERCILPKNLNDETYRSRLTTVRQILYLLFTEGYLSSRAETAIRRELCEEAIRLTTLLAEHRWGQDPETFALLALMHLHLSRMKARQDPSGGLFLLEEQDRALWDNQEIRLGMMWLAKSSQGDQFSRFHAEAGIAAEHCLAPSYQETSWEKVVACYELLEQLAPSAIHRLNRAVAVTEWKGPVEGLAVLNGFEPPTWLTGSYFWSAVLADLHGRLGHTREAERYRQTAFQSAPSPALKALLQRRLNHNSGSGKQPI